MKKLALSIIAALTLTACAQMESGKVVDKTHVDEYITFSTMCMNARCTTMMLVPTVWPPVWELRLKDPKTGEEGWRSVSEHEYNSYHFGQIYP